MRRREDDVAHQVVCFQFGPANAATTTSLGLEAAQLPPAFVPPFPASSIDVESVRPTAPPPFTMSFSPQSPAPTPPKTVKAEFPNKHAFHPKRIAVPRPSLDRSSIPLSERLQLALQPPISTLLGDSDVWLPFAPFEYQFDGIRFLYSRFSALLGDEMGLGKTMQTILAMRLLFRSGSIGSDSSSAPNR